MPGGIIGVLHYHLDHLGSVQVITKADGGVYQYIRYKPYGEVRGHWGPGPVYQELGDCGDDQYCREFTGYDTEPLSGLAYAGARVYDPALGQFLTHDPARQFASPYTYTNWNPTNLTDPNGACVLLGLECLTVALIAVAATTAATMIDVGIRSGGNAGAIFSAGMLTGMIGIATVGIGFGLVGPAVGGIANQAVQQAVVYSLAGAGIASGGYGTYQAFDNGYYASGVVGAVLTALSAYQLAQDASNGQGHSVEKTGGDRGPRVSVFTSKGPPFFTSMPPPHVAHVIGPERGRCVNLDRENLATGGRF